MINFDKCITVFSYNGKGYDRSFFEGVSLFGSEGIELFEGGFKHKAEYKIRIPSDNAISIKCGDRIMLENADVFNPENAYTIMEIKDNRRGSFNHYLLTVN